MLTTTKSGTIWFSLLVQGTATGHSGLTFNLDGYLPTAAGATSILLENTTVNVRLAGSTTAASGTFTAGTTHLILGKMIVGGGNDTMTVWVDPDLSPVTTVGQLPAADFSSSAVDFASTLDRIGAAVWTHTSGSGNGNVDAILLSDSATGFYEVTGISVAPPSAMLFIVR